MLLRQVALVSETSQISASQLASVSAAVQKQVTRDFGPIWDVDATVDAFPFLKDVPTGYWPVFIRDDIKQDKALGVHLDNSNQPFALVQFTDSWPLTVSHETLEMLADPFGNRLSTGDSPKPGQGRVEFLVEVSDPSEAAEFGYTVNGITLSDFYTPNFFDPIAHPAVRYSFTGAIKEPRQVLNGGYLSWHEPVSDHWFQETFFDGDESTFNDLGKIQVQAGASLRSQLDKLTNSKALSSMVANKTSLVAAASVYSKHITQGAESEADRLHAQIEKLNRKAPGDEPGTGNQTRRRPVPRK